MRLQRFEPPGEYYNENITKIDEEICRLIRKRKEFAQDDPGFPTATYISKWAEENHFEKAF